MPSNKLPSVKCESTSDEEDCSRFPNVIFCNQLVTSDSGPIKTETDVSHEGAPSQLLQHLQASPLEELVLTPAGPAATPVSVKQEPADMTVTLETLESAPHAQAVAFALLGRHMATLGSNDMPESSDFIPLMSVKDEPLSEGEQQQLSGDDTSDSCSPRAEARGSAKAWTQRDMETALEALRSHNMSLTKASMTYGIPSTTLWQRAHRLGIDTPKKESTAKSWSDEDLKAALLALRAGAISANKASKAYGIPSSTLYKIARREGIRLSAPFNAAPTSWRRSDLARALSAIRAGASTVQRAASQYGIPTGTLYGRCKREGIELSRSNPAPWTEDAMGEALEAVRIGQMSINQAAIHFNLPYSSLYGRFKRCKYQTQELQHQGPQELQGNSEMEHHNQMQEIPQYYQHNLHTTHRAPEQDVSQINPYIYHPTEEDPSMALGTMLQDPYSTGQAMYYAQSCSSLIS